MDLPKSPVDVPELDSKPLLSQGGIKSSPLRRPEIPDILKHNSNSPVQAQQNYSVDHKPPPGPEFGRGPNLRTSLRKPADTGTNFMLSKRISDLQKDDSSDLFRLARRNLQTGDGSEPGDSTASDFHEIPKTAETTKNIPRPLNVELPVENDVGVRLDALRASAEETMARVEKLSSISVSKKSEIMTQEHSPSVPPSSASNENTSVDSTKEEHSELHEETASDVVAKCAEYLSDQEHQQPVQPAVGVIPVCSSVSDVETKPVSHTGQKNWQGGSERNFGQGEWVVQKEEIVQSETMSSPVDSQKIVIVEEMPTPKPPSILKKKSLDESDSYHPPVSILKRKSLSEVETGGSSPSPPSEPPHSILKKRISTEERTHSSDSPDRVDGEIRSFSPEPKPILKQRRRSMDDRTKSPEPQSILKRKSSREDVEDRTLSPEPHGILKRKSSGSLENTVDHVEPKPILKKKGSAEDGMLFGDRRPILKKKSSTDDELEEKKLSSILRSPLHRSHDDNDEEIQNVIFTEQDSFRLRRKSGSRSDGENNDLSTKSEQEIKSILRKPKDKPVGILKNTKRALSPPTRDSSVKNTLFPEFSRERSDSFPGLHSKPRTPVKLADAPTHGILKKPTSIESELGAILKLRRAREEDVDTEPVCLSPKLKKPEKFPEKTLSVMDRIFSVERKDDRNINRSMAPLKPRHHSLNEEEEALLTKMTKSSLSKREKDRFRTQPITLHEIRKSSSLETERTNRKFESHARSSTFEGAYTKHRLDGSPKRILSINKDGRQKNGKLVLSPDAFSAASKGSGTPTFEQMLNNALENMSEAVNVKLCSEDTTPAPHSLTLTDVTVDHSDDFTSIAAVPKEEPCEEQVMSVSARAKLFTQLEQKKKAEAESWKSRSVSEKSRRYKEKNSRYSTQPVTSEEVEQAVKMADSFPEEKDKDNKVSGEECDDSDPSRLSLAERVRLFNRKVTDDRLPPLPKLNPPVRRRRSLASRFKTQPVTIEEVEKAKSINPLTASLIKPPDPEILGRMSFREARNLMFEHGSEVLHKSSSLPPSRTASRRVSLEDVSKDDVRGILKHDSSDEKPEIRSILKMSSPPAVTDGKPLKSVLKKESSFDEPKEIRSILKPETADFSDSSSSSEDVVDGTSSELVEKLLSLEPQTAEEGGAESSSVYETAESGSSGGTVVGESDDTADGGTQSRNDDVNINNDAVARRRLYALKKQQKEDISSTSGSSSKDSVSGDLRSSPTHKVEDGHQKTSPAKSASVGATTKLTLASEDSDLDIKTLSTKSISIDTERRTMTSQTVDQTDDLPPKSSTSIKERLAALQKSEQEGWRKRLTHIKSDNPSSEIKISVTEEVNFRTNELPTFKVKSQESQEILDQSSSLLDHKKALLDNAKEGWKKRVGEKDANQFTVANKLTVSGLVETVTPVQSPAVERKKKTPKPLKFRSKTVMNLQEPKTEKENSLEVEVKNAENVAIIRSHSVSGRRKDGKKANLQPANTVHVPKIGDEEFDKFFQKASDRKTDKGTVDIKEEDFDKIISESRQMLVQKRNVQIQRRRFTSRNPVKALALRTDLQEEYQEVKLGVGEQQLKMVKLEKISKGSSLAVEALAGLASKEDFTAVALKKTTASNTAQLAPHRDLMLLQVKGRRHVQTRLVEPSARSVNSGDNYILVTPNEVYNWIGEFSNVIERAKGAEVALNIQQKKDLGCSSANLVYSMEEDKLSGRVRTQSKNFWRLLEGDESSKKGSGVADEDEFYEASIIDTNMIYEVDGEELVPLEQYWGTLPKIEMLDRKKVLVFDFGSEMYVWNGKQAPFEHRKVGLRLARELWEEGYDYSECDINPIYPGADESEIPKKGMRPQWALFAKQNQHMETVLFREKFLDWPDLSRIIKAKKPSELTDKQLEAHLDLQPYDAKLLLEAELKEPDLELEGSHLGRGVDYFDSQERRHFEITTLEVRAWHILEFDKFQVPKECLGQFHAGDTYVVRWLYMVTQTGRDLSGQASKHAFVGRERCAYFFWQGRDSTINEKGASALMTVELDAERGPQIRVVQGKEPPAFLNLFEGSMVIHIGKREEEETNTQGQWRLYFTRGEKPNEASLVEVHRGVQQLRSRASFILLNVRTGAVHLWHGAKSQKHTRQSAKVAVKLLMERKPLEVGINNNAVLTLKEQFEGAESREFWEGVGGGHRNLYQSLLDTSSSFSYTPRLYHMASWSGKFTATEVLCPFRHLDVVCPYPFLQADLYKASQPALFLLDNETELWLWQGWWPEGDEENDNTKTGSGKIRWNAERRAAMETTMQYSRLRRSTCPPKAYLISAGLEPLAFTNLFPEWIDQENIARLNIEDGKKPSEQILVCDVLSQLNRSTYTLSELQERPLPEGVDPGKLETYLSDDEFLATLGMDREKFQSLPHWKQTNLKKTAKLF